MYQINFMKQVGFQLHINQQRQPVPVPKFDLDFIRLVPKIDFHPNTFVKMSDVIYVLSRQTLELKDNPSEEDGSVFSNYDATIEAIPTNEFIRQPTKDELSELEKEWEQKKKIMQLHNNQ